MSDERTTRDAERDIRDALAPFGWACSPTFWHRYYCDPWVFHLANAVEPTGGD